MKSETTNTILIFVLGVFVALDVLFAVRTVTGQRELRSLNIGATQAQNSLIQLQQLSALVGETRDYASKHPSPELNNILNLLQPKPVTR